MPWNRQNKWRRSNTLNLGLCRYRYIFCSVTLEQLKQCLSHSFSRVTRFTSWRKSFLFTHKDAKTILSAIKCYIFYINLWQTQNYSRHILIWIGFQIYRMTNKRPELFFLSVGLNLLNGSNYEAKIAGTTSHYLRGIGNQKRFWNFSTWKSLRKSQPLPICLGEV